MNKITILSEFQKEFRKALEKTSYKEIIIDNEIKEIDNFLEKCGETLRDSGRSAFSPNTIHRSTVNKGVFKLGINNGYKFDFLKAYKNHLFNGEHHPEIEKPIIIDEAHREWIKKNNEIREFTENQAYEFLKYHQWLLELRANPRDPSRRTNFVLYEKLKTLEYLGLDFRNWDKIKSAKILKEITGHSVDAIRKTIPQLYGNDNIKYNKNSLIKILGLFKEVGLIDESKTVNEDLSKLK